MRESTPEVSAPSPKRIRWLGGLLLATWLLWSGHYTVLLIALGVLSCGLVLRLSLRMRLLDEIGFEAGWLRRLPGYIAWLIGQIVLANLDVARRILDPRLPISPTLVRLRAESRTEVGWVVFGNSITLTPGTITLRLRSGVLLVHALTKGAAEALEEGDMNRRVGRLEGHPRCSP